MRVEVGHEDDGKPQRHGDRRSQADGLQQDALHAVEFARSVVVADDGLRSHSDAHHRHEGEHAHRHHHAHNGERAVHAQRIGGAVEHEQVVLDGRGHCVAQLHDRRCHAERADAQSQPRAQSKRRAAKRHGRAFLEEELHDEHGGDRPRTHRGQAGTAHAAVQNDDEQVAERHVGSRADEHGAERAVGMPRGADEVVHAERDELQRTARHDGNHEVLRQGQHRVVGAREAQNGFEGEQGAGPHRNRHEREQRQAVAQNLLGHIMAPLPQPDGRQRVASHAHQHGHGRHGRHGGVGHRGGRQAVRADGMAHIHRVDDVVEHLHHNADDRGDGELQQQPERARRPHAADALLLRRGPCNSLFPIPHARPPLFSGIVPVAVYASCHGQTTEGRGLRVTRSPDPLGASRGSFAQPICGTFQKGAGTCRADAVRSVAIRRACRRSAG